jgi:uncharacterized protein
MSKMKINLDRLGPSPETLHHEASAEWWRRWSADVDDAPYEVVRPFVFDTEVCMVGEQVQLRGGVAGEIDIECGRCVKRYRQALRDTYRLVLEPIRDPGSLEPETLAVLARHGLCLKEDLEAGWYRGREIELDAFYAEVISLALPIQPLCKSDCAGLCPHCGIDRSEARCDCSDTTPESPFAVLKALKALKTDSRGNS